MTSYVECEGARWVEVSGSGGGVARHTQCMTLTPPVRHRTTMTRERVWRDLCKRASFHRPVNNVKFPVSQVGQVH